jgi:demethylmenaquinone methyltransferase / 2-methoxy-6-polyprenyl-1,4-benzoquinol methylase
MPADFSGPNRFARDLFGPLPARYDRLAEILSFGQNGRWRSAMVDHVLPMGSGGPGANGDGARTGDADAARTGDADAARTGGGVRTGDGVPTEDPARTGEGVILDVASGTAGVALQLEARSGVRVVGVDLTEEMLRQGHRRVVAAGRGQRIGLVAGRAEQLPFPDRHFDALTFTYLLRYVQDPQATLTELARVLRPGGTMASLEFAVPADGLWRPAWWAYTRMLLPAGGLLLGGREWYRVGRFLGPNISAHYRRYPVSWTVQAWQKAGFTDVGVRVMSLGGGLVMWGTRAAA